MQETTGKDVTGQFKPLTEAVIAAYTDQGSYSRGDSYMRNGNMVAPTLRGVMLRALCKGKSGGPYRVEVSLVPKGEASGLSTRNFLCHALGVSAKPQPRS